MDRKLWLEARAIAGRRAFDREAREDLAQDLAVAALERGEVRRPAAWLERVARNTAIDRWRLERRREALAPSVEPPGTPADPEAVVIARERRRLVRGAVAALPRAQRRVALLRFHCDLSFEEVGGRLDTGTVTARTRLHRALAALRARLGELRALLPAWPGASLWPAAQTAVFGLALVGTEAVAPPPSPVTISAVGPEHAVRPRGMARSRIIAAEAAGRAEKHPTVARDDRRRDVAAVPPASVFVFEDDLLSGDVVGPDGEKVQSVTQARHSSLIELRQHFVAEMVKSLEEL